MRRNPPHDRSGFPCCRSSFTIASVAGRAKVFRAGYAKEIRQSGARATNAAFHRADCDIADCRGLLI